MAQINPILLLLSILNKFTCNFKTFMLVTVWKNWQRHRQANSHSYTINTLRSHTLPSVPLQISRDVWPSEVLTTARILILIRWKCSFIYLFIYLFLVIIILFIPALECAYKKNWKQYIHPIILLLGILNNFTEILLHLWHA